MEQSRDIFDRLGVKKFINAAGTYTAIGGDRMSEEVIRSMQEAARSHVEIRVLQKKINEELARLTGNEGAVVTAGATAGLYLALAGCLSSKCGKAHRFLTQEEILTSELLMFKAHRNPFDQGAEVLKVRLVELGYPNHADPVTEEELRNAITPKTFAFLFVPQNEGGWIPEGGLSLEDTLRICHEAGVPVLVDAAAQLPPKSNLTYFTKKMGADAVIFSGGKHIGGPQTTGLVLGKKQLIDWISINNFPNYGIGRMNKIGREELCGIYSAMKEYMVFDDEAKIREAEQLVASLCNVFGKGDVFSFERSFPNESGQPTPRAKMLPQKEGLSAKAMQQALLEASPAVYAAVEHGHLFINPMMMSKAEGEYLLSLCQRINSEMKGA